MLLRRTYRAYVDSYQGLSRDTWLLALLTLINRSGTMVVPFLSIYLASELGLSKLQIGMAMSAFGAGSVGGSYLGGWLTDKLGYYRVMFWTLLGGGVMFWWLMTASTFESFAALVFVVALVGDAFRPAAMAAIGAYARPENRTRSMTLIRMAINIGFAAGSAVGGFLAQAVGFEWLFIIDGSTCVLAAFALLLILKPRPQYESAEEAAERQRGIVAKPFYRDTVFVVFLAMMFVSSLAFMQLFSTYPLFVEEMLGLTKSQLGGIMALNGLLIAALEMPIIHRVEQRYRPLDLMAVGMAIFAFGYLVFVVLPWEYAIPLSLFSIVFLTFGEIIAFPVSNSFALQRAPAAQRGRYMGAYGMNFSLSLMLSPTIGFYLTERLGYAWLWAIMGIAFLVAATGLLVLRMRIAPPTPGNSTPILDEEWSDVQRDGVGV